MLALELVLHQLDDLERRARIVFGASIEELPDLTEEGGHARPLQREPFVCCSGFHADESMTPAIQLARRRR